MKSKKNQYILLATVLVVWGLIIFRFFNISSSDDAQIVPIAIKENITNDKSINNYIYELNYRDPFLKGSTGVHITQRSSNPQKQLTIKYKRAIPDIQLIGLVSSKKRNTAIIKVMSQSHIVTEGDIVEGFQVKTLLPKIFIHYQPLDSLFELKR